MCTHTTPNALDTGIQRQKSIGAWRGRVAASSTHSSCGDWVQLPALTPGSPQLPVTLVLGRPVPSGCLHTEDALELTQSHTYT